jgi:hypothetical protein
MGRVDSLASKSYKSDLKWNLSIHPYIILDFFSAKKGFLNDITFFANGEWMLHRQMDAKTDNYPSLLLLENSAFWEHPKNKGTLMLTVNNKWEKEPQMHFEEILFGQEATAHYTGRQKEDYSLRLKREEATFALNELEWISYEGEFAWLSELGLGFSLQPFYSRKYTDGFYMKDTWNATLQKGGINGRWQSERGSSAQLGIAGNYVEKSSALSPYSAVDGFEEGFSWRGNALVQISFNEHFYLSMQYIVRIWHKEVFQKFSLDAKAMF